MKRARSFLSAPNLNQQAQATLEYILMLAFVVAIFMAVFKGVLGPALSQLRGSLVQKMDQMVQGENLHRLMIGGGKKR